MGCVQSVTSPTSDPRRVPPLSRPHSAGAFATEHQLHSAHSTPDINDVRHIATRQKPTPSRPQSLPNINMKTKRNFAEPDDSSFDKDSVLSGGIDLQVFQQQLKMASQSPTSVSMVPTPATP